jgi:hypothetical protein
MGLRVLHLLMAALVFISTIGVTVNRHYCQKQLRSTGLWWMPKSCHETTDANSKLPSCPFHAKKSDDQKRKCCSEESDYVKSEINQDVISNDFFLSLPILDINFPSFIVEVHTSAFIKVDYDIFCFHPPPDKISRQILYQSFLI